MALAKEESMLKFIRNFSGNTQKTAQEKQTKGFLCARRALLETYWIKYNALYDEILQLPDCEENHASLQIFQDGERFAATESTYCENIGELNDKIDQLNNLSSGIDGNSAPDALIPQPHMQMVKSILPKIQLPTFDGSFHKRLSFKDMFITCVIKDTSLSNVQRLHYLKSSLKNEADAILRNISVVENNFQIAWDILLKRYDNKRRLVKAYLRDILKLPAMNFESLASLKKLVDGTTEAVRALSQLGRPTSQWDDWLVFLITEKLNSNMLKDWEISLSSPNEIPTDEALSRFLENRIQGFEAIHSLKTNSKDLTTKPTTSNLLARISQSNNSVCQKCLGKHSLMYCPDFRKLSPMEKLQFILRSKLCKNCFKSGHIQADCMSKFVCLKCGGKHHTFIHDVIYVPADNINALHTQPQDLKTTDESQAPVILATAYVGIRSDTGHYLQLRALLDNGSQSSFISEYAAQQLHLKRTRLRVPIIGAGAQMVSCHGVSWHFIPPGSPNFGGIWEAGIKSMKYHLKRTIGEALLTFEEFYTILKQIEAVLNSRPLSALSDDPTDCTALTPGHFTIGGLVTAPPEPSLLDINSGRLSRWKQVQQDFWKRWSFEYLQELQVRHKCRTSKENLKVGDLVLFEMNAHLLPNGH